MAELYFKVHSDWQEVVRLRNEIVHLESKLNQFNGKAPLDVLDKMCDELTAAKARLTELVNAAAIEGSKLDGALKKGTTIDMSTPIGQLKAFDDELIKLCSNLNTYFDTLKGKLQDLTSVLGNGANITDNIKVNDDNIAKLEELKRQNAELMELVKKRQEELEKEREIYNQLANAVRTNNTSAISMMTNTATESVSQIKAKIKEANAEVAQQKIIVEEMSAAYDKQQAKVDKLEKKLAGLKAFYGESRQSYNGQSQIIEAEENLRKAQQQLTSIKTDLTVAKDEQKQMNDKVAEYEEQLKSAGNKAVRMRTQIMNAREAMMQLIAAGKGGTPEFQKLAEEAGTMRRHMALANATMQYFATPNRHLEGLKTALQGVAGAASLATGILGIFNTNSEKMAEIQTKIQSYLGVIIGLESAYAAVKKTSNAMLLISEVRSLALAKAKTYETVATNAGTIATMKAAAAQAFFNTVAKMNPYLLLISGIGLLCGAIWGLTKVLNSESEAEKKLQKEREARIKEAREAHEKWANEVASSAGKQIASYENLKRKWKELGNDLNAKKKFIDDNKDAFHDLGWAVNNVADAENLFTKNTQAVINAMLARAKAAAYQTAIADEYAKSIKKRDQIDNTVAGGGYRRVYKEGDRLTNDQIKALNQQYGVNLSATSLDPRTQIKGVSFSTDSKLTAASAAYLTSLEAKDATKRWKANVDALNKETEERVGYLTKGLEQAVKQQEQAVKAVGVQEWQGGGKRGNNKKGNSPDDIVQRQLLQQQEAARIQHQNQLLQEQAVIDQMDDGAEKELAQMRLNHKKRMAELDNEQQDILNKKIETASKDKSGNTINGFYTTGQYKKVQLTEDDMLGVNSKRMSELIAFFDSIGGSSAYAEDRVKALRQAYSDFMAGTKDADGNPLVSDDILNNIEAQFNKVQDEIRKEELRAMRDYLREYGSFEQQKLAITQDYEERIKKARTEGERMKLEKERDKALSSLSYENISMGIDWSALLKGVGSLSQEMLKPMLEQLQAFTKTDEFNEADIQEREKVIELINELRRYVGTDQNATWQQLSTAIAKFSESVAKYKEAENNEKVAIQNVANARTKLAKGEITQADFERMQREANELGQKTAEARDEMQNLGRTLNETSEQVKGYVSPLTTALSKMTSWSGVEGFSGLQNSVSQIDQLKGTLDSILPSMGDGMAKTIGSSLSSVMGSGLSALGNGLSSVMSSGIGGLIGIIAQIPKMILQIAEIIKNVVTGILDAITTILKLEWVSDLVNSILEAVGNLIDAIFDLPENLFKMLSSIVVDGVGGLVDGVLGRVGNVLSFGLLDSAGPSSWFTNGNEEEVAETSKALTEENERLRKSIDRLNDSMNKKSGVAAIKDYEQLVAQQRKVNANLVAEIDNQMGYHSAHHSNNYYANDDVVRSWQARLNALFREHQNDYGKNSVQQANLSSGIGAFYQMTPEQLAIVRDYAGDIWEYLTTVGKYDKSEYWENAADAAGEVQKITHSLYENLTQMSFDTLKDNFLSSLMDMSTDWDDTLDGMMDNFEEMFRKAALNFALSSVNQELQEFWEDWGERMKAGTELTEGDIEEYKRRYQQLVEKGLAERERIADITGYDETHAAKQEADKKGFAGMSQDLGEELNGRFTAVQIAGENISAQMNVAVPILTGIGVSMSRTAEMVDGIGRVADDMLTNIVECYTELNLIRINTDDMYKIMKENKGTLEKIEKNTQSL